MTVDYTFDDAGEARRYLSDVGWLWSVWMVALVLVTFGGGLVRLLGALGGLALMAWRAGPIQRRAALLVPEETARTDVGWRGGPREKVFRELAYGREPLRRAIAVTGASSLWLVARWLMIGATLVGFALMLGQFLA